MNDIYTGLIPLKLKLKLNCLRYLANLKEFNEFTEF
jgi:hypothetical protein